MPKTEERRLRRIAKQRGYTKERSDRYVYGTIANQRKRASKTKRR